jgi:hypothetical protein
MSNGWIGVDLDGTLAEYHGFVKGQGIGKPIPKMIDRVKIWLNEGKDVRIFTARAASFEGDVIEGFETIDELVGKIEVRHKHQEEIEDWCLQHLGKVLPITCMKDPEMIELWDDRCKQVIPNSGITIDEAYQNTIDFISGGE